MVANIHDYEPGTLDFLLEECDYWKSEHLYDEANFPMELRLPDFVEYADRYIGDPVGIFLTLRRKSQAGSRRFQYVHFVRARARHDDKWLVLYPINYEGDVIYLGTIHAVNIRGQRLKTARGMWRKYLRDLKKV